MSRSGDELAWLHTARERWDAELSGLDDAHLNGPSLLSGWTRQHVLVHVAYNAKAIGNLLHWAQTGVETPMYASPAARDADIEVGANLPGQDAVELYRTTDADLAEAIGNTTDLQWRALVRTRHGLEVEARTALWMRARELWVHLVDLNTATTFSALPDAVLQRVLRNVVSSWRAKDAALDVVIEPTGGDPVPVNRARPGNTIVTGRLAAVTQWAAGRGGRGVSAPDSSDLPDPPDWL